MAIFGIGAMYEGRFDKSQLFKANSCACIGWAQPDAPALYEVLKTVKNGSIVYIKKVTGRESKTLRVMQIGIVTDNSIRNYPNLGRGVEVNWLWSGDIQVPITSEMYKYNVFNNTLYEEYNPELQKIILGALLQNL